MQDRFADRSPSTDGPAFHGFAITTSDGTDLTEVTRALYVGGAGAVHVLMASGGDVTFANVAAGTVLPIRVQRVLATGTTATLVLGLV